VTRDPGVRGNGETGGKRGSAATALQGASRRASSKCTAIKDRPLQLFAQELHKDVTNQGRAEGDNKVGLSKISRSAQTMPLLNASP